MATLEPSPRPWKVRKWRVMTGPNAGDDEWVILDARDRCVATLDSQADAELILMAVEGRPVELTLPRRWT